MIVSPGYSFTAVALPQLMTAAEARHQRLEICEVRTADQLLAKSRPRSKPARPASRY